MRTRKPPVNLEDQSFYKSGIRSSKLPSIYEQQPPPFVYDSAQLDRSMSSTLPEEHIPEIEKASLRLAIAAVFLAGLPWLIAFIVKPAGSFYIGSEFATDDQMVYAAWIHQAMNGHFFFDNRFAVDSQPGITVHLYFWLLGLLAMPFKAFGAYKVIPVVAGLARLLLTFLFVRLLGKLSIEVKLPVFVAKVGIALACFGAGVGFTVWEQFGRLTTSGGPIATILESRLPIDVWQPEAFGFPSMLVNGLFMAALCLIVTVFLAVVRARDSWKPVAKGAIAMLLLMNIHSYDVLIVLFVLVAFAVTLIVSRQFTTAWALRAVAIGAGAIPAALWYVRVIQIDPVFQARAATLTYSPTFRQVLFGILPLFALALYSFAHGESPGRRWGVPALLATGSLILMVAATGYDPEKTYFVGWLGWGLMLGGATVIVALAARQSLAWNFFSSWALVGLVLPFLPQLFQRKLAMGLAIPWGFVAAWGLFGLLKLMRKSDLQTEEGFRRNRNMVAAIAVLICCATNIYWIQREVLFIRDNISSTTVQPIFLTSDVGEILAILDRMPGHKVVVARPGATFATSDGDRILYLPDLNPLISGFAGAYTYAGHWSETPNYNDRRRVAEGIFHPLSPLQIDEFLRESGADYLVQPIPEAFPELESGSLSGIGEVEYEGRQYRLIRVDKSRL